MDEAPTLVECATCGIEFPLIPYVILVPKLTEHQPPTQPIRIKRSTPCLKVNGTYVDYCSKECFKTRDEVADCSFCGLANPSDFHTGRQEQAPDGVRCPGCCGPVYRNHFCAKEEAQRFTSYTCGKSTFKIGLHGSLAYIRASDDRDIQQALDEEFAKKQADRDDYKQRFLSGEHLTQHSCWGGRETVITHCPKGRLEATTHNVDCKCVKEGTNG